MRLTFTKRNGRHDELTIERDGKLASRMACPKQGIIPHDMVHFAVESVLSYRGFLALLDEAETPGFGVRGGPVEEGVERLVECLQAEMWGRRVPTDELLAAYELACDARGHEALWVSTADIAEIRTRLDELTGKWEQLPVNASLVLERE